MSDLIFAGELDLSAIPDGEIGEAMIAYYRAHPGKLSRQDRMAIAKYALLQDQAERAREEADAQERKSRFGEWVSLFLETRKSKRTREAYAAAIDRLLAFCRAQGIEPSSLDYEGARRFSLSAELNRGKRGRRSAQSARLDLSAVSSLYSELDRLSDGKVRNPFSRMGGKPPRNRASGKRVPSSAELEAILANTSGIERAAIACMAFRGFRIGALPTLHLSTRDGATRFEAFTKGKPQSGELPKAALEAIGGAGLSRKSPFAGHSAEALKMKVQRELDRLAAAGLIAGHEAERAVNGKQARRVVSDYSCHSFRHFFAVQEYCRDRDIERLRRLLNHADLGITQVYLQSLGLLEE